MLLLFSLVFLAIWGPLRKHFGGSYVCVKQTKNVITFRYAVLIPNAFKMCINCIKKQYLML